MFEIIFGRLGKGRFNQKGDTCSFVRECVDFKETESECALSMLPKRERKPKIKHNKLNTHRKEKSLIGNHIDTHHDCYLSAQSAYKTKSERVNKNNRKKAKIKKKYNTLISYQRLQM